jgi:hypothetical protein
MDNVLSYVWWRHAVMDAHNYDAGCKWRHGLRVTDRLADVQCTGVSG